MQVYPAGSWLSDVQRGAVWAATVCREHRRRSRWPGVLLGISGFGSVCKGAPLPSVPVSVFHKVALLWSLPSEQRRPQGAAGACPGATAPGHGPGARNPPTVEGRSLAVRPSRQQATSVQQGRCGQLTPAWPGSGSVGHLSDLSGGSAGFLKCRGLSPSPRPLFPQNNTIFFKAQFPIDK